jgi:acyl-coenzyme A synthetase/AMP-(fatty) acid ligase
LGYTYNPIEHAKTLEFVMYAGGPLTTATGSALSKVTDVYGCYGSTETSPVQALVPLREDWDTLEFHPLYGADFQPSDDEAYELVLHRDPKLEGVRGFDCNFRDIEEWCTKDLFRPHATKPNLWRFHGRTDDIIVLSNGEKLNPVPSEAIINSHPLVTAALIVGQGYFQAALLVESVKTTKSSSESFEVWLQSQTLPSLSNELAKVPSSAN